MLRLASIGLGNRASSVVKVMMQVDPEVKIVALVDPDLDGVRQRMKANGSESPLLDNVRVFPTPDAMLEYADEFDGVIVGTRCHLHSEMACKVGPTGLPLYLEKPISITRAQLENIAVAFKGREDTVVVSFPLRTTPLFTNALEIVRSGRLGTVNQIQAINNVPYGGTYYGQWYRNYDQVGGLWLQKATHDFDYLTLMLDRRPLCIAATTSNLIYHGDKPHDLRCSACDEAESCIESHRNQALRGDAGAWVRPRTTTAITAAASAARFATKTPAVPSSCMTAARTSVTRKTLFHVAARVAVERSSPAMPLRSSSTGTPARSSLTITSVTVATKSK